MKRCIATLTLLLAALSAAGRTVYPLNEGWRFFFRHENSSDNARIVSLPHTWDTDITGSGVFLRTTGTYLNEIFIPAEWKGKRLFLKFYGAQSVADLCGNGRHAASTAAEPRLSSSKSRTKSAAARRTTCAST